MSAFAAMFAVAQGPIDTVYGEPVTLVPQIGGGRLAARGDDPNNPPRVGLIGCFGDDPDVAQTKGSGANTHDNADVLARRTLVDFDDALFAAGLPPSGWLLVATSQSRQPRYEIVSAEHDGVSRVVCRLVFRDYAG